MHANNLVALGDSHLDALELAGNLNLLSVRSCHFCIVPGATVIGLRNPNSITDAISIYRSFLSNQPRDSHVLTHLGEVDCGFVFWWRARKYGESVEKQFDDAIDAYRKFLIDINEDGFSQVCVSGASLPTIRDGVDMGAIANKRAEISVGLKDRTEITLRFNERLVCLSKALGLSYFDLSGEVMDRSTQMVSDFYRNQDERDHHLDKHKVVGIWTTKCNQFLGGFTQ